MTDINKLMANYGYTIADIDSFKIEVDYITGLLELIACMLEKHKHQIVIEENYNTMEGFYSLEKLQFKLDQLIS